MVQFWRRGSYCQNAYPLAINVFKIQDQAKDCLARKNLGLLYMTEKNLKDEFHLCYILKYFLVATGSDAVKTCQESLLRFLMSGASEVLFVRRLGCVFNIDAHVVKVDVVGEHGKLKLMLHPRDQICVVESKK